MLWSQAVILDLSVESAYADIQRRCREPAIAIEPAESVLNKHFLHPAQGHRIEIDGRRTAVFLDGG